jgi:carbon starvation protein
MHASVLLIVSILILSIAYRFHGRFLTRKFRIDPDCQTPAHTLRDGVDYVPAKPFVLLGHHFASIAGAGPIVGPVLAAVFGWGPVWLWLMVGVIFIGGVHDFGAMVASIRHQGKSIGQLIDRYIGKSGKVLFLLFTWFMLILVIAVFARTVASIFVKTPAAASSSALFILLAVCFGLLIYQFKFPFQWASLLGVLLLLGCIVLGNWFPVHLDYSTWIVLLFVYVFIASVTPVWILLQPRDYLNSFLLYALIIGGIIGIVVKNPRIEFPVYTHFNAYGPLFPILFVTVACGAISGFHSLVASGTSSKQLDCESDAKLVGYGGMLIEAILAVIALITAVVLVPTRYREILPQTGGGPIAVFAQGVGGFMTSLGIPLNAGVTFAALAISAFAMTTLDTATRLARFSLQEISESVSAIRFLGRNRFIATLVTIIAAAVLAYSGSSQTIWPLFGSANQMLAAMALLAVSVWMDHLKEKSIFVKIPMFFMLVVTITALGSLVIQNFMQKNWLLCGVGTSLFIIGWTLIVKSVFKRSFWKK